jgi:hypothetical protein
MAAFAAFVVFVVAALDVQVDDWSLPWLIPVGLALLALSVATDDRWPPSWRRRG